MVSRFSSEKRFLVLGVVWGLAFLTVLLMQGCGAGVCAFGQIGECNLTSSTPTSSPTTSNNRLTISPLKETRIPFNSRVQLTVTGGAPPYAYAVVGGSGTFDINTPGVYVSPAGSPLNQPITVTLQVTDSQFTNGKQPDQDLYHRAQVALTVSN